MTGDNRSIFKFSTTRKEEKIEGGKEEMNKEGKEREMERGEMDKM